MKRLIAAFAMTAVLSFPMLGQQRVVSKIVVKVNKDIILASEVKKAEDDLRSEMTESSKQKGDPKADQLQKAIDDRLKDVVRDLIDKQLILQTANDMGLDANLEVLKEMEQLKVDNHFESDEALEAALVKQGLSIEDVKDNIRFKNLRAQLFRHEVTGRIVITTEEMRTYYEAHKQDFDKPPGLSIGIILVTTEGLSPTEIEAKKKTMAAALAGLNRGEEFEDMARKYSEDSSSQEGGILPFFERKSDGSYDLPPEMTEIVSKLAKGKYTDVITNSENHTILILKLIDRHDGGILPFDSAQNDIYNVLLDERAEPKARAYLTKLRAEGYVEVSPGYIDTGAATKPVRASDTSMPGQ